MHSSVLLLLAASTAVLAQDPAAASASAAPIEYIDPPNGSDGWCYWCSDDDAPPLCNAQCQIAIDRLCKGDTTTALTDTEGDCTIKYMPPTYPVNRQGSRQPGTSARICQSEFTHILANCGKDASTPYTNSVNTSYCTTSGGGGTYGWMDDGTVMEDSARYVITTKDTSQCGQHKASWQDADKVIKWNPIWVPEGAQVKLDTNPPPLTGEMAAMATSIPQPNPECEVEVCNLKDQPYYAHVPVEPWAEGGSNMMRHRMVYEGWSDDPGATAFRKSINDRCGEDPGNWQPYLNGTGPQHVVDFNLSNRPKTHCECASWAAFEASGGGIDLPVTAFCESDVPTAPEFNPVP